MLLDIGRPLRWNLIQYWKETHVFAEGTICPISFVKETLVGGYVLLSLSSSVCSASPVITEWTSQLG